MKKIIGIVGGVGPYAGLDLNQKVFDNMQTNGTDQDYLDVFLLSRSSDINDRTAYLKGEVKQNPAFGIYRTILKLESIGANVIAIPCNTAHSPVIYDEVKRLLKISKSKVKLLHIVKETHKYLAKNHPNIEKIGLLGTLGTYESKLYENFFLKKKKFQLINPDDKGKRNCHEAIYDTKYGVKAFSNPVTQKAKTTFEKEIENLASKGAKAVILGCTEIPLAFIGKNKHKNTLLIDPTNILAKAMIENAN